MPGPWRRQRAILLISMHLSRPPHGRFPSLILYDLDIMTFFMVKASLRTVTTVASILLFAWAYVADVDSVIVFSLGVIVSSWYVLD